MSSTDPEVSNEFISLIKRLSSMSLSIEKAIDMLTASGSPSGIATTTTVIDNIIYLTIQFRFDFKH